MAVDGPGAPVDVSAAVRLTDERLYVGKVVEHAGTAYLMAFRNQGPDGSFAGLIDPMPSLASRVSVAHRTDVASAVQRRARSP